MEVATNSTASSESAKRTRLIILHIGVSLKASLYFADTMLRVLIICACSSGEGVHISWIDCCVGCAYGEQILALSWMHTVDLHAR